MRSDVTQILAAIDSGDPRASEALLPLVYEELRTLAARRMEAGFWVSEDVEYRVVDATSFREAKRTSPDVR